MGFSPRSGGDAALAAVSHAEGLQADGGFQGEVLAVAPQWSIAARRRLALIGERPFAFRALEVSSLAEDGGEVDVEPWTPLPIPPERAADALESPELRALFLRALSALEGLAAKHGGSVRGTPGAVDLVLMARRTAVLRATGQTVLLETLLPERGSFDLAREGLASGMDRLEGQLRKRLNDRRVRSGDEGVRARALAVLAEVAGLRSPVAWPLGGSDPEVLDLLGLDAQGRPVLGAVRDRLGLADLGPILDAVLAIQPALALLFVGARTPVRLGEVGLALGAHQIDDAVRRALASITLHHALYELRPQRGESVELELRESGRGARAPESEREGQGRRRRRRRGGGGGNGRPAERAEAPREEPGGVEEISLFDLDDDARPAEAEEGGSSRGRRRRRGGRRRRESGARREPEASAEDARSSEASPDADADDDEVEDPVEADGSLDPAATLAPIDEEAALAEEPPAVAEEPEEDEEEEDDEEPGEALAREREARRQARLAKLSPEPEPEPAPKAPRRRAAIVTHADRDSVIAGVLLARDLRLVEGFWIYPQEELMTFFRSIATDLRADTPIHLVGFTARPARDSIQAASLYAGRLTWYDHHEWPPEDLVALRSALGADSVRVAPGAGSSLPEVLENRQRRSRFSDKLVELATGRFSQHDYERWGRSWWQRLGDAAARPGERRSLVDPLLAGRPSELAREAARRPAPPVPPEVPYVSERDFRVVHFGGISLVVVEVPEELDLHLTARVARERFGAEISLAYRAGRDLVVLGGEDPRARQGLELGAMVDHLAAKHEWIDALSGADHVARMRVHRLAVHPERLDELVAEVAMGRSILEG